MMKDECVRNRNVSYTAFNDVADAIAEFSRIQNSLKSSQSKLSPIRNAILLNNNV